MKKTSRTGVFLSAQGQYDPYLFRRGSISTIEESGKTKGFFWRIAIFGASLSKCFFSIKILYILK